MNFLEYKAIGLRESAGNGQAEDRELCVLESEVRQLSLRKNKAERGQHSMRDG